MEINLNNCLLQQLICYRYYKYFQKKYFAGSTIASFNQSLHFRLMWNHDILDLRQIFALQVRKLWRNSPFSDPNMKACLLSLFCFVMKNYCYFLVFFATWISLALCSCFGSYLLLSLVFFRRLIFPDLNDNVWQVKKLRFLVNA